MVITEEMLCSRDHAYLLEKDNYYYVGLTDYFIKELEGIVFLELPEIGSTFNKGEIYGTIQGVNSSTNLYIPIGGTIVDINEEVVTNYDKIFETTWLIKIESETAAADSIDLLEYEDYLEEI